MEEIKRNLSVYQEQTKRLTVRKARVESHEAVKQQAYNDIVNRINNHKKTIEKNVHGALGQKIQII
jgi:hypothetical protein